MGKLNKFSPEGHKRAVRMEHVLDLVNGRRV